MSNLFIDLESIPEVEHFADLSPNKQDLFRKKFAKEIEDGKTVELLWAEKAGLYAEFAKVVCISMGFIQGEKLVIKSLCSRFEDQILKSFESVAIKVSSMTGHNGIDFDFPFLKKIPLPPVLDVIGRKPWELKLEDTMDMWGSPAWKSKCSLALIAECFGLPNPKDEMSGSSVAGVYYGMFEGVENTDLPFEAEEKALGKIAKYCELDVITTVNIYQRMKYKPIFTEDQIVYQ